MNNENLKGKPAEGKAGEDVVEQRERKLSEDEQQTNRESACREHFMQDWVISSSLTPEQKISVAEYINAKPGAWREYNGQDFKVVKAEVDGNIWRVSFGVYFDDYETQRIDVEIPLAQ